MSEKKSVEVEVIPLEAVIDIKVSGEFASRLKSFITDFFPYKSNEHYSEIIKHIKDNTNQDDPYVYHFKTLIALQSHLELEAKAQKKTSKVKLDYETGEIIPEENPQPAQ